MPEIDTLEKLIFGVVALVLFWAGKVFGKWFDETTEARRKKIDKQAKAETRARLLTESLYEHRSIMLQHGWSREQLPPFIKQEEKEDH